MARRSSTSLRRSRTRQWQSLCRMKCTRRYSCKQPTLITRWLCAPHASSITFQTEILLLWSSLQGKKSETSSPIALQTGRTRQFGCSKLCSNSEHFWSARPTGDKVEWDRRATCKSTNFQSTQGRFVNTHPSQTLRNNGCFRATLEVSLAVSKGMAI